MILVVDRKNIQIKFSSFGRTACFRHVADVTPLEHYLKSSTFRPLPFQQNMDVSVLNGECNYTNLRISCADSNQVKDSTIIQVRYDKPGRQYAIRCQMIKMKFVHHKILRLNLLPPT